MESLLLPAVLSALSLGPRARAGEGEWSVTALEVPAPEHARWPCLTAAGDRALLVWTESEDGEHLLRCTRLDGEGWSDPVTVAAGRDWFVNWADVPRVAFDGERAVATWLSRSGEGTYAYGVRVARSDDGGARWSAPAWLHDDRSATEHGFVSLVPRGGGRFAAVWLDGREMHEGGSGAMTVRARVLEADGSAGREHLLDDRVCECCPTAMTALDDGTLVVAYRDRAEGEVRDIVVQRGRIDDPGSWKRAQFLTSDGWVVPGCPVNGPSLDARGRRAVLAWYTGAEARAHVRVAFSNEGATRFGRAVDVESVNAVGRVQVAWLEGGAAVVWMDEDAERGANWFVRWVSEDLELGEPTLLGSAAGGRHAGYPSLQPVGDGLVCVFTDARGGAVRAVSLQRDFR